jgi:methylated-DNA-[protein]-cysteine S-methyltransferase
MNDTLRTIKRLDVDAASRRASEALARRAAVAGLVDVAITTVDTPVGALLLAATREGLIRVAFPEERPDLVLQELADLVSPRVLEDGQRLSRIRREVDEYFEGRRRRFTARIDWALIPGGFSRRVLEETARIPYGSVSTYGEVANRAGSRRAARAAGNALHDNPVPVVVPCHRVVPSSGGIGRYGGSEWRKEYLLTLEGWLAR